MTILHCFYCGKRNRLGVCQICWIEFKRLMMRGER